jgi:hypothetical protein
MSELVHFILLVNHSDGDALDRITTYFKSDSRPDFPEDVPTSEEAWVDAYEILPYPTAIKRPDSKTLILEFEGEGELGGDFPEEIATAISLSRPDMMISYSNLEDHELYERWQGQRYKILWDVDAMYEDETASLNEGDINRLKEFGDDHEKVLLHLENSL